VSAVNKTVQLIKRAAYAVLTALALGFTWGFVEAVTNRFAPVFGVYRNHDFLSSLNDRAIFYATASAVLLILFLIIFYAVSRLFRSPATWITAFETGSFWVVFVSLALNLFWLGKSGAGIWLFIEKFFERFSPYVNPNILLLPAFFYFAGLVVWTGFIVLRSKKSLHRAFSLYAGLALLAFFGCQAAELARNGSRPVPAGLPDVYVITVDACRYDYFTPENAPKLIRYAEENCIIFTNARSPSSWTTPSFASFFSGLPPTACLSRRLVFGTGQPTLAELLYENGYDTYLITGNPILDKYRGLHRGFVDHEYWTYSPLPALVRFYDTNMYNSLTREFSITTDPGLVNKALTEKTLNVIKKDGRRPKFVWVHYMDPHWPYYPLPEYVDERYAEYATDRDFCTRRSRSMKLKTAGVSKELYAAEIRMLDDDIPVLFNEIDETGDALIIFTSDHGEEFFEHGNPSHGFSYYEEVVRVPCFVKLPEGYGGVESPSVVERNVNLVSLAPTILEILGIETPAGMQNGSFVAENPPDLSGDTSFSGTRLRSRKYLYMAVKGNKKIILEPENFAEGGEYFDLYLDPYEKNPLPFDETAEEMRVALADWATDTEKLRDALELPPGATDDSDLRALGYVK
jgi:arylsulfatase A-like enzyme